MAIPPLNTVRVQFFFADQRMEWSEIYYAPQGTSIDAALAEAKGSLAVRRARCLGRNVRFAEIRASVDNVFRDSLVVEPALAPIVVGENFAYDKDIIACGPASAPTRCLRLRQEATSLYRRITYFSGVPDSVVNDQGNWSFGSTGCAIFDRNFQAYLDYLNAAGTFWGFVGFQKPPTECRNILAVTRVSPTSLVQVQYDGDNTHPFAFGSTVQLSGVRNSACCLKANGKFVVAGIPTDVQAVNVLIPMCGSTCGVGGRICTVNKAFHRITSVQPDGWAIHKRGAVELAPRGRSRVLRPFGV